MSMSPSASSSSVSPTSSSASVPSSSSSTSNSFWPRNLIFASPHPTQLEGGRQIDVAPMCPCNSCWEYGSHTLAPPRPARAPKAPKAPKTPKTPKPMKEKKSPLQFLKKANASKESVASDMRPLRESVSLASAAGSVYGTEY